MSNKQLDRTAINLRIAFNYWYSEAKSTNIKVIFITFILVFISICDIVAFNSKFNELISILNALWVCISILLNLHVDKCKGIGADIQELFDSYVFDLHSCSDVKLREYALGKKVKCALSSYKNSNINYTEPYYDELTSNSKVIDILNVQKSNINYDKQMRETYFKRNIIMLTAYILFSLLISCMCNLTVEKFITAIILPSISMISYFLKNSIKLYNEKSINDWICCSLSIFVNTINENFANKCKCTEYQYFIHLKRKTWTIIPDYIYKKDKQNKENINNKKINNSTEAV